jgi:hypothetical protein
MLRFRLLLAALVMPGLAIAQTDFERCAAIESASERLACFDALTRSAKQEPPATAEILDTTPATPQQMPLMPRPVAPLEPPAAAAVERFGAENLPPPAPETVTPERIESRLQGRFTGWERDTVFELDNGQAWQCQNCRPVYHQAEAPPVSIRRSFTGVYWLKVEGLNQQAKVRRVK